MAGPYFVIAKVEPDYTWWEIDGPNNLGDDEDKIVGELNRLAAENAALRAEVERLREAVLAAYRKGHHHTVNGGYQWCDQGGREVVEEIIREAGEEE